MARLSNDRGPVGQAAEAMKDSLVSKLRDRKSKKQDSSVQNGLIAAINLIDAFLHAHKEEAVQLDQLKAKVKAALLNNQPSSTPRKVPPLTSAVSMSQRDAASARSVGDLRFPPSSGRTAGADPFAATRSCHTAANGGSLPWNSGTCSKATTAGVDADVGTTLTFSTVSLANAQAAARDNDRDTRRANAEPLRRPSAASLRRQQAQHIAEKLAAAAAAGSANPMVLYTRSRDQPGSDSASEVDWMLPVSTLAAKAFVKGTEYGKMALVQDSLSRQADVARRQAIAASKLKTAAMFEEQVKESDRRRELERQARVREMVEAKEAAAAYNREEIERLHKQEKGQQEMRAFYKSQLDDVETRRREEAERLAVESYLEKQKLEEEARAEKQRQAEMAERNREQRAAIKLALQLDVEQKAVVRAKQMEEDRKLAAEAIVKMDRDEEARRKVIVAREEKLRRAFERGGGVGLTNDLAERRKQEAEEIERQEASEQRRQEQVVAARTAKQREAKIQLIKGLSEQTAEKEEAARRQREEKKLQAMIVAAEVKKVKETEKSEKAALEEAKAVALRQQRAAVVDEHRRKFAELRDAIPETERGLHRDALGGLRRSFANLSVPRGFGAPAAAPAAKV